MELVPVNTHFDFMRLRMVALVLSLGLLFLALASFPIRGLNFALDFTGGSVIELKFDKAADLAQVRSSLESSGYANAVVQSFGSQTDVVVRLQSPKGQMANAEQTAGAVLSAVQSKDNTARVVRSDFVGPQVGKELAENGIIAILFVAIGFLVYISARFEWKFALAAIATTVHDVIVVTGYFAITQKEFDLVVLAGVLSVMGYSINDTIVVFDRVRENFRTLHKLTPEEVLNRSVNQTLSRTILTSLVALLTVVALYLVGGNSLRGMAESQIIGIVIGTLSSIFFACPLLLWLKVSKQDLLPKMHDVTELERRP